MEKVSPALTIAGSVYKRKKKEKYLMPPYSPQRALTGTSQSVYIPYDLSAAGQLYCLSTLNQLLTNSSQN